MTGPLGTTTPDAPVGLVRRQLEQTGARRFPVLDGELLVGIVSYWDVLRADSDTLPVRDLMTRSVYVVSPDTTVREAARIFRQRRVPVLPVLDGRRLVGMISAADVLGGPRDPSS